MIECEVWGSVGKWNVWYRSWVEYGDTCCFFFFFQAEDGIRDAQESRGLGDVYKRQTIMCAMMSAEKAEKAIKDGKAKKGY